MPRTVLVAPGFFKPKPASILHIPLRLLHQYPLFLQCDWEPSKQRSQSTPQLPRDAQVRDKNRSPCLLSTTSSGHPSSFLYHFLYRHSQNNFGRAQSPSIRTPSPSFFATEVRTERNSLPGPSKPIPAKFFDAPELPGTSSDGALFWKPIVQPCISETVQVGDPFKDQTEPAGRFIEVSKDKPTHALYWNRRHPNYSFLQEQRTIFDASASTSPSSFTTATPMSSLPSNAYPCVLLMALPSLKGYAVPNIMRADSAPSEYRSMF
ncbi:hypothetical protein EV359DRAFT_84635 [Lentinula novae-zelandiae]|nr:hypothetical protein EV359DRAFT_84635 [Lentinula novae-zelandiae]